MRAAAPLRSSYQWAPTRFEVVGGGAAAVIRGPVHNLGPRSEEPEVYAGLEDAFTRMLPQFVEAGVLRAGADCALDVVVKAQLYALKAGMSYSGRWHMEGLTEGIVASGVY